MPDLLKETVGSSIEIAAIANLTATFRILAERTKYNLLDIVRRIKFGDKIKTGSI